MRTKILAICFALVGLGSFAVSSASAREVTVAPATAQALPATARVNLIVAVDAGGGGRYYRRHHYRHYGYGYRHGYRRGGYYYRHGHRIYRD